MNPELQAIHSALVAMVSDLSARLGRTTDSNEADKILLEIQEVTHRINMLQQVLFVEASAAIAASAQGVQAASSQLRASIATVAKIAQVVNGISAFLAQVDQLIDLAKILMV